jgi:putative nucleotidyltransferase with HDIG domain
MGQSLSHYPPVTATPAACATALAATALTAGVLAVKLFASSSSFSSSTSSASSSSSSSSQSQSIIEHRVFEILRVYRHLGEKQYIGEDVSIVQHSLLAAYQAQIDPAADDEVVVAAFLHDIGHMIGMIIDLPQMEREEDKDGSWGTVSHDTVGANYLRFFQLPERVCKLVEQHVSAKRYLVAIDPTYHAKLSPASQKTLTFQGGPMSVQEQEDFRNDPLHPFYLKFRQWEELAKKQPEDLSLLPTLDSISVLMVKVLKRQQRLLDRRNSNAGSISKK